MFRFLRPEVAVRMLVFENSDLWSKFDPSILSLLF